MKIDDLLAFDPLSAAEDATGKSWQESGETSDFGVALHMLHNRRKEEALRSVRDTTFSCDLDYYLSVVEDEGFEEVLSIPFESTSSGHPEKFMVFFKRSEGVLLKFDTYRLSKPGVNGGSFYYNVRPFASGWAHGVTSSGCFEDGIWVGSHDCREALRHHMQRLREWGEFITPWAKRPFLWLLHHEDDSDHYDEINAERIAMLPEHVRDAIARRPEVGK